MDSTSKTHDRSTDAHGNDLKITKKFDKITTETENLECTIHKKSFNSHTENELLEDVNISNIRYQKSQGHLYHTEQIKSMEYNSYKDLVKAGISNYDLQAAVAENTRQDFRSLLDLNGYLASFLLQMLDDIFEKHTNSEFEMIASLIITRNQRLTSNATNLTCDGYYDSSMILIRTVFENQLLLEYLKEHPSQVKEFYNMKLKIRSQKLINFGKKKHKEYGKMWGELCENYVHATMQSIITITTSEKKLNRTYIHTLPFYQQEDAQNNLSFNCMFKLLTLFTCLEVFKDKIKDSEKLWIDAITFKKIFEELQKNPKLKIKFGNGDPTNL